MLRIMQKRSKARRISISAQKRPRRTVKPSSEFRVNVFSTVFTAISALASAFAAFYAGAQSSISAQALSANDRSAAFSGFYAAFHDLCNASEVHPDIIQATISTDVDFDDDRIEFQVEYDKDKEIPAGKSLQYAASVLKYADAMNYRQSLLNVYLDDDQRDELEDWRDKLSDKLIDLSGPEDVFNGTVEYGYFLKPAFDLYGNCTRFERSFPPWFIDRQPLPPWSKVSVNLTTR